MAFAQIFDHSTIIHAHGISNAAMRLNKTVNDIAALIEKHKPGNTQGIFIDTGYRDGKVLQACIDRLGPSFHYYGFEGRSAYCSNALSIAKANENLPVLSLRVTGISNKGEQNFAGWPSKAHKSYAEQGANPFIVLNTQLGRSDFKALKMLEENNDLDKIGMVVAVFRGATSVSRDLQPAVGNGLQRRNIPVIEQDRLYKL